MLLLQKLGIVVIVIMSVLLFTTAGRHPLSILQKGTTSPFSVGTWTEAALRASVALQGCRLSQAMFLFPYLLP